MVRKVGARSRDIIAVRLEIRKYPNPNPNPSFNRRRRPTPNPNYTSKLNRHLRPGSSPALPSTFALTLILTLSCIPDLPSGAVGAPRGTDAPMPILPGTAIAGAEAEATRPWPWPLPAVRL